MKQSHLFTKTRKHAPSDEVSKNAQLLIRAGFIHKEMAGVYAFLPLGLRVIEKIKSIVREEMNAIGGQEIEMTVLQDSGLWEKTDRWSDKKVDNWFKTKLSSGAELGLGFTHEEPVTNMLLDIISSYRDLPLFVYQFQSKFRNELRAKSGLMRGREFLMKDMYSFSRTEEEFELFYEKCADAYVKVFEKVGLGDITFRTKADGGSFTKKFTDEFQTLSEAGEDTIYLDRTKKLAINKEVFSEEAVISEGLNPDTIEEVKAIEVGNIFPLETKFSEGLNLKFTDENGESRFPIMGSYGIGISRLMAVVAEIMSDEAGLVWPESIAPFKVHLIQVGDDEVVKAEAEKIYSSLLKSKVEVLFDDRDISPGQKFGDSDLIGIPNRAVVSTRSLEAGGVEVKGRTSDKSVIISVEEFINTYA